jgi:hypothetical protein
LINAELAGNSTIPETIDATDGQRLEELIKCADLHVGMGLTNSMIIGERLGAKIVFLE